MISLPEEYPLTSKLPWKRPPEKTWLKKAKYITTIPEWTTNITPPQLRYLQLDGVTNHILPLIEDPHHLERPSKKTINKYLKEFTIKEFEGRPNPPHTYPLRNPATIGPKGLLPRKVCHLISSVRLGHGFFP